MRYLILLMFFAAAACGAVVGTANIKKPPALLDGFVIDGIDGKIVCDSNESWSFCPFEEISDNKVTVPAGKAIGILPSSTLEKFASVAEPNNKNFRIWGKFTQCQNKNYIYLTYYLPVKEVNIPPQTQEEVAADANEEQIIPDDVLELLKPKRTINLAELKRPLSTDADGVIVDRTGFLRKEKDGYYFDFNAIGRNIDKLALPLLPCETLDLIIAQQKIAADPLLFKISSIATGYKGKNYLLLQRATRTYGYGNFAK